MLTETKGWLEGNVIFGQPYILASLGIATGLSIIELSPIILFRNLSPRLSVERPPKWIYAAPAEALSRWFGGPKFGRPTVRWARPDLKS